MLNVVLLIVCLSWQAAAVRLAPAEVTQFDLGRMKGAYLQQLAWSPDGDAIYLQTYDPDRQALPRDIFHFVLTLAGGAPQRVSAQPEWASTYWAWKAAKAAPGRAGFEIEIEQEQRISAATALPMGGDLARGGVTGGNATGASAQSVIEAARASENQNVYRMRLRGAIIGEWINHRIMPGLTFGWGPTGSGLIAFSDPSSGQLVIMDAQGERQKVDGTRRVLLPAWNADGSRLLWLEERGGKTYAVMIATVAR